MHRPQSLHNFDINEIEFEKQKHTHRILHLSATLFCSQKKLAEKWCMILKPIYILNLSHKDIFVQQHILFMVTSCNKDLFVCVEAVLPYTS